MATEGIREAPLPPMTDSVAIPDSFRQQVTSVRVDAARTWVERIRTASTPKERTQSVHTLLKAVYPDSGKDGPVTGIEPKETQRALFDLM